REGRAPVEVGLGVPLALLAALVERAQIFGVARVVPGPMEIDRAVDVQLLAQRVHPVFVYLDHLEAADATTVLCQQFLIHGLVLSLVWGYDSRCAIRPKRRKSRTSRLRRRTSAASNRSLPTTVLPNSPDANGNSVIPTSVSSRCCTLAARSRPLLIPSRSRAPALPKMRAITSLTWSSSGVSPGRSSSSNNERSRSRAQVGFS